MRAAGGRSLPSRAFAPRRYAGTGAMAADPPTIVCQKSVPSHLEPKLYFGLSFTIAACGVVRPFIELIDIGQKVRPEGIVIDRAAPIIKGEFQR